MKTKYLITLSLLFAFSFSMIHEYAFTILDENRCSVGEYVSELKAPSNCGDICDIHYEYHQAYMFPQKTVSIQSVDKISELILKSESYNFLINLDLIIPPTT